MTVCSYIKNKKNEGMSQTQAVTGTNSLNSKSLESSDSVQENEGSQEDSMRKSVTSTVAQQSDLSDFHLF